MEKLTYLEEKILIAISETHTYSFKECERVYRRCKSFDETIRILKFSSSLAVGTDQIMHDYYNL